MERAEIKRRKASGNLPADIWLGAIFKKKSGQYVAEVNDEVVATGSTLGDCEVAYLEYKFNKKGAQ